jgi:hypothetical protein
MKLDERILEELNRYNSINNYITEQGAELPLPPEGEVPPADPAAMGVDPTLPPAPGADLGAGAPPAPAATPPQPDNTETDPDVEKIGDEKQEGGELEITDLVKSQKNIEDKQEEYFDQLFSHLNNLEGKLGEMDTIVSKLNDLEAKVEKYRTKSPEEKLELRTLDSGPFNQKLTDFFEDKEEDFEKLGRDEYILTKDEVENYSPNDIKKSFRNFGEDESDIGINNFNKYK